MKDPHRPVKSHAHQKKIYIYISKIRKGEWEKDKKKNGRIWWRTKGNHEGESGEDQALTSQVVLLIKVFNSASVRKWRHRGRYKGSDTWDWRGNIILDAKN